MDRKRTIADLDVHKDSIYLSIMQEGGRIIFERTYGTLTPEIRQMCVDMLEHGVREAAMESIAVYWVLLWNELCRSMEIKLVNPYFIKQLPERKSFNIMCDSGAKKIKVSYPKLKEVKKKIVPDMTVRLGRSWRQAPENYQWFAGGGIGVGGAWLHDESSYLNDDRPAHELGYRPIDDYDMDKWHTGFNVSLIGGRVKSRPSEAIPSITAKRTFKSTLDSSSVSRATMESSPPEITDSEEITIHKTESDRSASPEEYPTGVSAISSDHISFLGPTTRAAPA